MIALPSSSQARVRYSKCLTLLNIIDRQYSGETRSNKMELQEMQHLLINNYWTVLRSLPLLQQRWNKMVLTSRIYLLNDACTSIFHIFVNFSSVLFRTRMSNDLIQVENVKTWCLNVFNDIFNEISNIFQQFENRFEEWLINAHRITFFLEFSELLPLCVTLF